MTPRRNEDTYAAIDLGSNSFHLVVAQRQHGELRFVDRIREMVRLGGGLDRRGYLDMEVQQRAIECLARFGQRLRGIPAGNIRAVGTQTLRRMRHSSAFLMVAETALGCPVDIIAGREEARLIYLGVSQGVSGHDDRRLVIDIGGGSTEMVIGEGLEPLELESLQFGCVSLTRWYFGSGKLSRRKFDKAKRAVLAEMQELQVRYRQLGWASAIGSSGTIRAIAGICQARGWCEETITADALNQLVRETLAFKTIDAVNLPTLSDRRHPVFIGGLVMLSACFDALGIDRLRVSPFALREGVLHDLLGRLEHRDPRAKTVDAFMARYGVDPAQVARVRNVALAAFEGIDDGDFNTTALRDILGWAAGLHETGLGVSHSHYQVHSGYLVAESDMAGFSQQEQQFLATLVRHHRREIPGKYAAGLPARLHEPLRRLLFCLRFAAILCRTRDDTALPRFEASRDGHRVTVDFEPEWAMGHPLTLADLEQERVQLRVPGIDLDISLGLVRNSGA
ncbi:Ppx/GppA family phosphatase [Marinihelvus fidelis]|uniref:Ppx/GppA family phosphatase n=1 Tax=Marinihelvus fidelis TaxID=2613842 RepID=A0A5N0T6T1_9GAMM|nr:Ppx/GppA phosphatase family protein [Marinihelvus fidelis]KAA9129847.1 Ppx/GppA family phosphatase [Marinihelvus fidelis]